MASSSIRIVRASPGLIWRAFDSDLAVGAVRAFLRPDDRWFIAFDDCRDDCCVSLLHAVADNTGADLYATADEADSEALARLARLEFAVSRREGNYVIPTDPAKTGLCSVEPEGVIFVSAADAYEDQLRMLDDALRQDVPGTAGWRWDAGDFREETFDSPEFDPALYQVAVEAVSGTYIGLVRVWRTAGTPRLGLIAVTAPFRQRGLAKALLARAFLVLHEEGTPAVTAEADETNLAATTLLATLGARRDGGSVELVRRSL